MSKTCYAAVSSVIIAFGCSAPSALYKSGEHTSRLSRKDSMQLLAEARRHIGEPYRYGGRTSAGWDCSGYVSGMFRRALDVELPRSTSGLYAASYEVSPRSSRPGDLVFFRIGSSKPSHVGIYIGNGKFIHASTSRGVIISSLNEKYYRKSFAGIRRPILNHLAQSR